VSDAKQPGERKRFFAKAWGEARSLLWAHRGKLAVGLTLMVGNRLAGFVLPGSSKFLIDNVIGRGETRLLLPLALAVGGATVVQAITTFALSQVVSVAAQGAIMDMRRRVQEQVTRLPVRFFDGTQTGVLISRIMSDAEGIRNLVGTGIIQLVGGLFTAVLALGVLLYLNWQLTVAILVFLALFGGAMSLAFSRLRPIFRKRGEINAEVTGRLAETLGGIRVVKAYRMEEREQGVFAEGVARLFANIRSSITGVSAITAFSTAIVGVVGVVMILVGGRAIFNGTMTLGDLIMFVFFVGLLAQPVIQMANIGTQISEAFAGLDRIRELMEMTTEDDEDERRSPVGRLHGDIAFESVGFGYTPEVPVLEDISLRAPAGTKTALVGSSGSGKSTLVSLIMAFNRPQAGRIMIDGSDLAELRLGDYRSQLGVVLQENFLFDGTIAENIRFARPKASREQIVAAARVANADVFIDGFPDGYDSVVGERGIKLSGGQRQRIAIARAILADPRILILDEATSSLDSESEGLIQEGLRRLMEGRTSFVIAHRLSTIRDADQILVLEAGEIVERGTHAALLARSGRYRELYDKQYAWEKNLFVNPGEELAAAGREQE
jgi:ABC-type multidrug transport system fused ATPase/permease subunit